MEPGKTVNERLWLPLLIFCYFETLRRTTFAAFGWTEHGISFAVITILVIYLAITDLYADRRAQVWTVRLAVMGYLILTGYFSYLYNPADRSFLAGLFFSVPDFGQGNLSPAESATFSFFLLFGYALLVFLVGNFILEKKSFLEIFVASTMLLGVEIAVADFKVTIPVVAHVFFVLLLRNQLRLLEVAAVNDIVIIKGEKQISGAWYIGGAALTLVGIGLALMMPVHQADLRGVWDSFGQPAGGAPAAVSSVESSGNNQDAFLYYWDKLNTFELQGSISVSDTPAMWVKSGEPFYWRGETADYYTGRGWRSTAELKGEADSGRGLANPYSKFAEVRKVEQNILLAPGMTTQVLFAANTPALVEAPSGRFKWDTAGNVFTDLPAGSTYKVVSYVPGFDADKLRKTGNAYPVEIRKKYLQLPDNLPPRVKRKARLVTARFDNAYDRAKAIEGYLAGNFPYDLSLEAAPRGRDAVDYFLFDLKKGYCTYHSTAMVVMLRSIGIPARWVKGYMSGVREPSSGTYAVSQADAHAWVEVYFADFGWVPFEPTASFSLPETQGTPAGEEQPAGDLGSGAEAGAVELPPEESEIVTRTMIILALLSILSGGGALWFFLIRKKRFKARANYNEVRDVYLEMLALMNYLGFPREETETPYEYARSLSAKLPDDHRDILAITEMYIRRQYGKRPITDAETEEAKAIWRRLADKFLHKQKD